MGTPIDTIEYGYDYIEWGQLLSSYDGRSLYYGIEENEFFTSAVYDGKYEMQWEHGHQLRYLYEFITEYYFCEYYFAYDANGMRTKMVRYTTDWECDQYWKDTYEYTYNGTQLTRMTYEGEAGWYTLDIRYDADGTPVSVTFEHVAHEPDMENGGYLDESSAYDCCSGTYYYITNLQGDVIALVDELGNLAASYTYDAWGNIVARTSKECIAAGNPLRYRGYVYDGATGFYYLQSRYYDPVKGRFISPDAFVSTGQGVLGNNMFAYCNNNPVMFMDPAGKFLISALIVIGAAVVVGAGTGAYIAACNGGDNGSIIEGAIEGALTGGAAAAIGFFAAPIAIAGLTIPSVVVAGIGGAIAGGVIDVGVQTASHAIKTGSLDNFKLDENRVVETAVTTGLSAIVPTFDGTPTGVDMAIGSAIVGAEASVLISTGVIVANKIRAGAFHGGFRYEVK